MEHETKRKNIVVIGTGGTIAGVGREGITGEYKSAQIKVDALVQELPYLDSVANVKSINMFDVDSCDITIDKLTQIAKYINEESLKDDIDGFVITHGTDTLEESAYFLNLAVKTSKPVILTGSMRPGTAISADGPLNLYQAVALAKSEEARNMGVLVVFCDGIYCARDICKINTFRAEAFSHKDLGCLGYMRDDQAFFYNTSIKKHTVNSDFDISVINEFPKVEIVYFYVDADINILDFAAKNSDGIVIAGAGCGGTSGAWDEKIQKLLEKGFPVVRSSRIGNGLVTFSPDEINKKGAFSNTLSAQKSRILLSFALTHTNDIHKIQEIFNNY